MFVGDCIQPFSHVSNGFVPGCRNEFATFLVTNEGRANTCLVVDERMSKPTFDTEELAVDSVHVSIASDHAQHLTAAGAQGHLAAVGAEVTSRYRLGQFPWTGLMTIGAVEQCAGRTNFNAVAALGAIEPTHVRTNHGVCAATACFDCIFTHPFVTNAGASFAKDAT